MKFYRYWVAEMGANQLLDSAEPGHIEPSDQSAAKDYMVIKAKGAHVEFHLCADDHCCYFHYMFVLKTVKSMYFLSFLA